MENQVYKIHFHGSLSKFYSDEITIYAGSVKEAFQGLVCRFGEEFRQTVVDGAWHIISGKKDSDLVKETDKFLSEQELDLPIQTEELHIFPAVVGAGGKGVGQIILGIVLIVVAVVIAWYAAPYVVAGVAGTASTVGAGFAASSLATSIALAGVMAVAGGVISMLSKSPTMSDYGASAGVDPKNSFIFNGAVNNTEQGVPVPLVYGTHLTGSTIISAGLSSERI